MKQQTTSRNSRLQHRYCVILAGGEGQRLRSLTRCVSADDRPKQFCPFLGGGTPLRATRRRVAHCFDPGRTLFVVTRAHERYYDEELSDVRPSQILSQPRGRGTAAAILLSLIHLDRLDPEASVVFLPSDHHYTNEGGFLDGVCRAFEAAERQTELAVLLGATPTHAEADYGWIEPGASIENPDALGLYRVARFWEKPSPGDATALYDLSCRWNYLWNTFVMVGGVRALIDMIRSSVPQLYESFERHQTTSDQLDCDPIYKTLTPVDFSAKVLSTCPSQLAVLDIGYVGWSDLGDPERVVKLVTELDSRCGWLENWRRSVSIAS